MCSMSAAISGNLFLKKYRGFEQFISRADVSFSPTRNRIQGRSLIFKVIHDLPEDFRVVDIGIQYKGIVM